MWCIIPCRELKAKDGGDVEVCGGHALALEDGAVVLAGEGDAAFFERAEEVEDYKVRLPVSMHHAAA